MYTIHGQHVNSRYLLRHQCVRVLRYVQCVQGKRYTTRDIFYESRSRMQTGLSFPWDKQRVLIEHSSFKEIARSNVQKHFITILYRNINKFGHSMEIYLIRFVVVRCNSFFREIYYIDYSFFFLVCI